LLRTRIITALILGAAILAALFFLPPLAAAAVLGLLWIAGAWEWAGLCGWGARGRALFAGATALVLLAAAWWALAPLPTTALAWLALGWWLVALGVVLRYPKPMPFVMVPVAGLLALVPSWVALAWLLAAPRGVALTLTALSLVWAADVGAYAFGRTFGRVRLAPKVSPGKTWEGVIGGMLLAGVVAWVAAKLLVLPAWAMVAVGLVTALISVIGDLTVSVLKRQAGLKDTGRLLPGHGGVMDRIDSLVAALPVYLLGLKLSGVIG
jgi:phosphatidate cytidylyltransferase